MSNDLVHRFLVRDFRQHKRFGALGRRVVGITRAHLSGVVFGEHRQGVAAHIVDYHCQGAVRWEDESTLDTLCVSANVYKHIYIEIRGPGEEKLGQAEIVYRTKSFT